MSFLLKLLQLVRLHLYFTPSSLEDALCLVRKFTGICNIMGFKIGHEFHVERTIMFDSSIFESIRHFLPHNPQGCGKSWLRVVYKKSQCKDKTHNIGKFTRSAKHFCNLGSRYIGNLLRVKAPFSDPTSVLSVHLLGGLKRRLCGVCIRVAHCATKVKGLLRNSR